MDCDLSTQRGHIFRRSVGDFSVRRARGWEEGTPLSCEYPAPGTYILLSPDFFPFVRYEDPSTTSSVIISWIHWKILGTYDTFEMGNSTQKKKSTVTITSTNVFRGIVNKYLGHEWAGRQVATSEIHISNKKDGEKKSATSPILGRRRWRPRGNEWVGFWWSGPRCVGSRLAIKFLVWGVQQVWGGHGRPSRITSSGCASRSYEIICSDSIREFKLETNSQVVYLP